MIVYGPLDRRSCTESISEHLSVVTGIGAEDPGTMATLRRPHLPRDACGWTTVGGDEDWKQPWELVYEPPSRYDGFWLSLILPELALRCRYRVPEFQMILLKFCGPTLVTVPSAAPIWSAGGSACGPPRSPVLIESIGEHLGVVRGIGTEDTGTLATPCNPYLPADHHYPDLNL